MLAHIVRIDAGKTHGWQVRYNGSHETSTSYSSKLFSDGVHGGKRKARKLAVEFLKEALENAGIREPIPSGRRTGMKFPEAPQRTSRANISGLTGCTAVSIRSVVATKRRKCGTGQHPTPLDLTEQKRAGQSDSTSELRARRRKPRGLQWTFATDGKRHF